MTTDKERNNKIARRAHKTDKAMHGPSATRQKDGGIRPATVFEQTKESRIPFTAGCAAVTMGFAKAKAQAIDKTFKNKTARYPQGATRRTFSTFLLQNQTTSW